MSRKPEVYTERIGADLEAQHSPFGVVSGQRLDGKDWVVAETGI